MRVTPYNLRETIDMLRARAFLFLMSPSVSMDSLDTEHGKALWELVGSMTDDEAKEAIKSWEATQ